MSTRASVRNKVLLCRRDDLTFFAEVIRGLGRISGRLAGGNASVAAGLRREAKATTPARKTTAASVCIFGPKGAPYLVLQNSSRICRKQKMILFALCA